MRRRRRRRWTQLNFIYPEDEALHRQLGELWLAQGNTAGAVREYGAVLAMKPLDMASAEYDLAKAYMAAGRQGEGGGECAGFAGGGSGLQACAEAVAGD